MQAGCSAVEVVLKVSCVPDSEGSFLACREASSGGHELDVPQQFGVWLVAGLGIVVAFRGTASQEDVIIDANISPVPLDSARPTRGL